MKKNLNILVVGSGRGGREKQRTKWIESAGTLWVWLMKDTNILNHRLEAVAAY